MLFNPPYGVVHEIVLVQADFVIKVSNLKSVQGSASGLRCEQPELHTMLPIPCRDGQANDHI